MKTNRFNTACTFLGLTLTMATFSGAMADDVQYLNSDPININGYVKEEVDPTDQELDNIRNQVDYAKTQTNLNKKKTKNYKKLVDETEKLSETSEEMIKERQQAQEDMKKYQKKIDCLMGKTSGAGCEKYVKQDKVEVHHAAPEVVKPAVVEKVEHKIVEEKSSNKFGESVKIIPYTGLSSYMTENENLESGLNLGLKIESNVSSHFAVGMGFKYTNLATNDRGNVNGNYYGYRGNLFGDNVREIEFTSLNFDLYSKLYFLKDSRFRPYVGAGIGYNRTTLEYGNGSTSGDNGFYSFGKEESNQSFINMEAMVGSEVNFTESIGMLVEFNYTRGFGNISSENEDFSYYAPDQSRLEELGAELREANVFSLFAGMLVKF